MSAAYEIETASGSYVDVSDPAPDTIRLEDIAHGLSHTCRFQGQCSRFYSVAEHAVRTSLKLDEVGRPDLAMAGLHHDDAEAYLGDIPRPIKALINAAPGISGGPLWTELEDCVDYAIMVALSPAGRYWNLDSIKAPEVKAVDGWLLLSEAHTLLPSRGEGWHPHFDPPRWPVEPIEGCGWAPHEAALSYLLRHSDLIRRTERTGAQQ